MDTRSSERGQSLVEYGLLIATVCLVVIGMLFSAVLLFMPTIIVYQWMLQVRHADRTGSFLAAIGFTVLWGFVYGYAARQSAEVAKSGKGLAALLGHGGDDGCCDDDDDRSSCCGSLSGISGCCEGDCNTGCDCGPDCGIDCDCSSSTACDCGPACGCCCDGDTKCPECSDVCCSRGVEVPRCDCGPDCGCCCNKGGCAQCPGPREDQMYDDKPADVNDKPVV